MGIEQKVSTAEAADDNLARVSHLLGVKPIRTEMEAHEVLKRGLSINAIEHLFKRPLPRNDVMRIVGIKQRTLARKRSNPSTQLTQEQSNRAWRFAETIALAEEVLGDRDLVNEWLERPVMGLNHQRPIDLLETAAGTEMVETFLTRIKYGIYS